MMSLPQLLRGGQISVSSAMIKVEMLTDSEWVKMSTSREHLVQGRLTGNEVFKSGMMKWQSSIATPSDNTHFLRQLDITLKWYGPTRIKSDAEPQLTMTEVDLSSSTSFAIMDQPEISLEMKFTKLAKLAQPVQQALRVSMDFAPVPLLADQTHPHPLQFLSIPLTTLSIMALMLADHKSMS